MRIYLWEIAQALNQYLFIKKLSLLHQFAFTTKLLLKKATDQTWLLYNMMHAASIRHARAQRLAPFSQRQWPAALFHPSPGGPVLSRLSAHTQPENVTVLHKRVIVPNR